MLSRPRKPGCDLEQKQFKLYSPSFRLGDFVTLFRDQRMPRDVVNKARTSEHVSTTVNIAEEHIQIASLKR